MLKLSKNEFNILPQDDAKATYWEGMVPTDGRINLCSSIYYAENLIRATTRPYPGAYIENKGEKIHHFAR